MKKISEDYIINKKSEHKIYIIEEEKNKIEEIIRIIE